MENKIKTFVLAVLMTTVFAFNVTAMHNILWYDKPAEDWQSQALPLGNGSLGCMVFGGVETEHIQFNHDTLWVGGEKDTGAYHAFGDIHIEFDHADAADYRRQLDISRAVHTVAYQSGGTKYKREYFSSNPDKVMVFRFTADRKKAFSGAVRLTDAHGAEVIAKDNRLTAAGDTKDHQYYWHDKALWPDPIILNYESQVLVLNEGGTVQAKDGTITFSGCDSLTILAAAGTDYVNRRDKGWTGEHPHKRITADLDAARKKSYADLYRDHVKDYRSLFDRLTIDLGDTDAKQLKLPVDQRMNLYKGTDSGPGKKTIYEAVAVEGKGEADPDLEELMFQYARYLMISCSRPGSLPANLQGLWNNSNKPNWRCDYHSDVNIQMNYWFVDPANLSECFTPLAEWFYSIRDVRKEDTKKRFKNTRGFAMHAENGIFGGSTYRWVPGDASWIANNIWDHFAYTQEKDYLRDRAYPIMKDLFMFWLDHLKEIPSPCGNGKVLVSSWGWSPEHGPVEEGVSYDQQLAWDLLGNFARAAKALGIDEKERKKALKMQKKLLGPQIGKWGQIQEWMTDRDKPKDKHRHLSHLIAVHPGRQISPLTTPKLAEAAKVSMNARGDGATGWSKAWKINMWTRLHDGDRAYKLLREMISGNVYDNLFDAHPPFQIDGNFGYASGICEMIVQSHMDQLHLLPALPKKWSKGSISGIKARGGFQLDISWDKGKLTGAVIRSENGKDCILRTPADVTVKQDGNIVIIKQIEKGVVSFPTETGKQYQVIPNRRQD